MAINTEVFLKTVQAFPRNLPPDSIPQLGSIIGSIVTEDEKFDPVSVINYNSNNSNSPSNPSFCQTREDIPQFILYSFKIDNKLGDLSLYPCGAVITVPAFRTLGLTISGAKTRDGFAHIIQYKSSLYTINSSYIAYWYPIKIFSNPSEPTAGRLQ